MGALGLAWVLCAAAAGDVPVAEAYHDAWDAWAVEGRLEEGHRQLRALLRRNDVEAPWAEQAAVDLARLDLLLGRPRDALDRLERLRRVGVAATVAAEVALIGKAAEEVLAPPPPAPGPEVEPPADPVVQGDPGPTPGPPTEVRDIPPDTDVRPRVPPRLPALEPPPATPASQDLAALVAMVDRRAEEWRLRLTPRPEPGEVVGLVGRRHALRLTTDTNAAYIAATYSFVHATRDDQRLTRNDWDVEFSNGKPTLTVNMTGGDQAVAWDLGAVPLPAGPARPPRAEGGDRLALENGHVILVHAKDSDSDLWVAMQVLERVEDRWLIFRWRVLPAPR